VTWDYRNFVVPAKAGTQWRIRANVAWRGTTGTSSSPPRRGPSGAFERKTLGSRFRGNDGAVQIAMELGDAPWLRRTSI